MEAFEELRAIPGRFPRLGLVVSFEGTPPTSLTVWLSGSIENEAGTVLLKGLESALLKVPSLRSLSLDVSGVRYASSSGLGVFAAIYVASNRGGVDFKLLNPSEHLTTLLNLLGFNAFLPIYTSSTTVPEGSGSGDPGATP